MMKISLILDLYFESYACLKIMSQHVSQLMAQWVGWHTLWVDPHESTPRRQDGVHTQRGPYLD